MKQNHIQLQGLDVSANYRTYSYQVIDPLRDTHAIKDRLKVTPRK